MAFSLSSSYFCLHTTVLLLCFGSAVRAGNETHQLALLQIKAKITNNPLGILSSWNSSLHFCQWNGVTCSNKHLLQGSISPHLGNLSFLRALHLQNNSLGHEIPQEIGRPRRLQYLYLGDNMLTGEIPSTISGCSNLEVLESWF